MKILEILLPKSVKDKGISSKHAGRIDSLQRRMNTFVDKIADPSTSYKGREFLKAKLKDDYDELRNVISDAVAEASISEHIKKTKGGYRLVSHTGKNLGDFKSHKAAAKHEGEVEYFKSHPKESKINEAVNKLPLTNEDFDLVKQIMSYPIPAAVAPIYLQEIIDDDEFTSMLQEWEETSPAMDVRPHVAEWFKRVMPDQMYRFTHDETTMDQKMGKLSPLHGYEPEQYHSGNDPITGNASGRA
jgi:hypothetical protein